MFVAGCFGAAPQQHRTVAMRCSHGNLQNAYAATTADSTNDTMKPKAALLDSRRALIAAPIALIRAHATAMTNTEAHTPC
jgi:hypothetical protein